jgi:hypothetical protein
MSVDMAGSSAERQHQPLGAALEAFQDLILIALGAKKRDSKKTFSISICVIYASDKFYTAATLVMGCGESDQPRLPYRQ